MTHLQCEICMEDFDPHQKRPVVGSCGHSYCFNCTNQFKDFCCPECRKQWAFLKAPPNFSLLRQLDERIKDVSSRIQCNHANDSSFYFNQITQPTNFEALPDLISLLKLKQNPSKSFSSGNPHLAYHVNISLKVASGYLTELIEGSNATGWRLTSTDSLNCFTFKKFLSAYESVEDRFSGTIPTERPLIVASKYGARRAMRNFCRKPPICYKDIFRMRYLLLDSPRRSGSLELVPPATTFYIREFYRLGIIK